MGESLVAVRWSRWGHDRLYVNELGTDECVGVVDLKTGETSLLRPSARAAFDEVVTAWCAQNRITLARPAPRAREAALTVGPASGAASLVAPVVESASGATAAVHVQRWRKRGLDRLYGNLLDGRRVGWVDVRTGEVNLELAGCADELHSAIRQFVGDHHLSVPGFDQANAAVAAGPMPRRVDPGWHDLAENRAGEAAHARALDEYARWERGAEGEVAVGASLTSLEGEGWRTLHAVPIDASGADIDHITIGPGGVYTVNAKNHRGGEVWVTAKGVFVDHRRTRYVQAARLEAQRAGYLLSQAVGHLVTVHPLVVVLADSVQVKSQPPGVTVLDRAAVDTWLTQRPATLVSEQVEVLWDQARRSTTWLPDES